MMIPQDDSNWRDRLYSIRLAVAGSATSVEAYDGHSDVGGTGLGSHDADDSMPVRFSRTRRTVVETKDGHSDVGDTGPRSYDSDDSVPVRFSRTRTAAVETKDGRGKVGRTALGSHVSNDSKPVRMSRARPTAVETKDGRGKVGRTAPGSHVSDDPKPVRMSHAHPTVVETKDPRGKAGGTAPGNAIPDDSKPVRMSRAHPNVVETKDGRGKAGGTAPGNAVPEALKYMPLTGAHDYLKCQDAEIVREIKAGNKRKAGQLAINALRGPPKVPIFFRAKWETHLALSQHLEPHMQRHYCDAARQSLQEMKEAVDSAKYLVEAATGRPQPMKFETKMILDARDVVDARLRMLDFTAASAVG